MLISLGFNEKRKGVEMVDHAEGQFLEVSLVGDADMMS